MDLLDIAREMELTRRESSFALGEKVFFNTHHAREKSSESTSERTSGAGL